MRSKFLLLIVLLSSYITQTKANEKASLRYITQAKANEKASLRYITQAKANEKASLRYITQAKANRNNYLKGFYITTGISESLSITKFKAESGLDEDRTPYDTPELMPNKIQSAKNLLNLGVGYEVNKFFAVEFNYKNGLLRSYDYEFIKTEDYIAIKNEYNKSDNYIMYLVGKLPLPTEYITPFVKAGLGYSEYKARELNSVAVIHNNPSPRVDFDFQKVKTKMNEISYHMQIGAYINLTEHNALSIFWGADYMSGKPNTLIIYDYIVDKGVDEGVDQDVDHGIGKFSQKDKKHHVFDNFIGINYIYRF